MTVRLAEIRESVASYLGGGGDRFDDAFLRAAKRVTSDINRQCFLSIDLPTTNDAQIALDEGQYYQVYDDGILHYMQMSGEWVKERNMPESYRRYKLSLANAQYHALEEQSPDVGYPERE